MQVEKVINGQLWRRFTEERDVISKENNGIVNQTYAFHGTKHINEIVANGYNIKSASPGSLFGQGKL